jgi:hypothetical protein
MALSLKSVTTLLFVTILSTTTVMAKEFKVECSSVADCMEKGDVLAKRKKLSLSLEAYRNAIKFDIENKDAWRKFEKIAVRISEEGGC